MSAESECVSLGASSMTNKLHSDCVTYRASSTVSPRKSWNWFSGCSVSSDMPHGTVSGKMAPYPQFSKPFYWFFVYFTLCIPIPLISLYPRFSPLPLQPPLKTRFKSKINKQKTQAKTKQNKKWTNGKSCRSQRPLTGPRLMAIYTYK